MPEPTSTPEQPYKDAKRRVAKLKSLYSYLGVYVVTNAILIAVWALSGGGYPWFLWAMFGMAVPIVFMLLDVISARYGKAWEEKKIRQYLNDDDVEHPDSPA